MFFTQGSTLGLVAEFALRLALGLSLTMLLAPWRAIPPRYFRTIGLNVLCVLVLAAFDVGFGHAPLPNLIAIIAACVFAYAATVAWGLGFAHIGLIAFGLVAALCGVAMFVQTGGVDPVRAAERVLSSVLLGSSLAAMLLGHHYLTAPAMSIEPLKRMIQIMGVALAAQCVVAAIPTWQPEGTGAPSARLLLLTMRWGFGLIAPAIGTFMAWRTALIRSTQSATGILYAVTTLILLGELAGLVLNRGHAPTITHAIAAITLWN